jgi:CheY-like chemotaxis protein
MRTRAAANDGPVRASNRIPRVLVVEDDQASREMLSDLLAGEGFEVRQAADGFEAAEAMKSEDKPDLILLDTWMPGMDGRAFLDWLRVQPKLDDIPVVVLTACPAPVQNDRALAVLRKPYDVGHLVEIVHVLCGSRSEVLLAVHARRIATQN